MLGILIVVVATVVSISSNNFYVVALLSLRVCVWVFRNVLKSLFVSTEGVNYSAECNGR